MRSGKALRVGCVKYLNARPLIRGWPGDVLLDNPANLCRQLAGGELDVALVSSFEFLRNPTYRIVDGISISSDGPVYSVFLVYSGEFEALQEIEIDPASQTAVNLLRGLLAEAHLTPRLVSSPGNDAAITPKRGKLLIGDRAIRFRLAYESQYQFWDLGEQWKHATDLPFVYALWLIRPEVADPKSIANQLRTLRDGNLDTIDELIVGEKEFDHGFCARYYRDYLRFSFGDKEKDGLRTFHKLCEEHGLLPKRAVEFTFV